MKSLNGGFTSVFVINEIKCELTVSKRNQVKILRENSNTL